MKQLFKKLSRKQKIMILISILFVALQVYLELKIPDYMNNITTILTSPNSTTNQVLQEGIKMLACALLSLATGIIVGYFAAYVSSSFSHNIRDEIFKKIMSYGQEETKKFNTSSLITRTTNDVTQVQSLIAMGMQAMIKAPIMATWAITKIVTRNITWSVLTAAVVLIILFSVTIILINVLPRFRMIQKLVDKLNLVSSENLKGIRVVRAFNAEEYQKEKFDEVNTDLTKNHLFTSKLMGLFSPIMSFMMPSLTLGIYYFGATMIDAAQASDKLVLFSNMVVFSSYATQVVMSFIMLVMIFIMYPRADISAKRICEVLNTDAKIKDNGEDNIKIRETGTVEFKHVSFKYPDADEYTIEDVSFKANTGDTIAFIGSTGSGKSTLINMVPRFYDPTEGEILVDGINIKRYKLKDLYNKIGYISQKPVLFSGTVKSNIKLGQTINGKPKNEKVKEAIKVAQAEDFVLKMEKKYDSHIAQGGTNISGGQKQRLSIARAIARNPEIYIFDDSFSALDYATDAKLRKELKKYTKDATTLIVAQRIGTIKDADLIIVLDQGKVVGMGTHKDLLQNCDIYREIAESQLNKEELYAR